MVFFLLAIPAKLALGALGFGAAGPIAGGIAATVQAVVYGPAVPAGSLFAILQSAAMVF